MSIAVALLIGLLQGSLHCAGMCGPFVLAYALAAAPPGVPRGRAGSLAVAHLAHNAGRVAAFAAMGAVFGGLGSFVNDAAHLTGLQAAAAFAGGATMILWAIDQARSGHGGSLLEGWSPWRRLVQGRLRTLLGRRDPWGAFSCGALLGLHPCGLLFAMLLAAASTGSALRGAAILAAFGLGTVPALLGIASAGSWGALRLRSRVFSYASAGLVGLSGLLFTLRGMAVNGWVPHVWPWLF